MKASYKALLLGSAVALTLGLGSCGKSEGNQPDPTPVSPSVDNALITADEATANNSSISVLKTAAQQGLKVKLISTHKNGSGGYNLLLSNERLVQVYFVGESRALRQSSNAGTTKNPIAAVDFAQKGKAIFTLLDKSKIELARVDTEETGAFEASQSVAPESKFLFSLLGDEEQFLGKTHSKAKAIEVIEDGKVRYKMSYNSLGFFTKIEEVGYDENGALEPRENDVTDFTWSGERLMNIEVVERDFFATKTIEDIVKLTFEYNQANQALVKSFVLNGANRVFSITYQPTERTVTATSDVSKAIFSYNEHYMLTKMVEYDKNASAHWITDDTTTYEYNAQGDLSKIVETHTASNGDTDTKEESFVYEYDSKGNWTKRTKTTKSNGRTNPETKVHTRKITY